MSNTLLLRLDAPLQSWSILVRGRSQLTQPWPSKSGVIGMVANALGRGYEDPIEDLASLKMGVRIDQPGTILKDYGVATNIMRADSSSIKPSEPYEKSYLSGSIFLAGLEGDESLLQNILTSLHKPARPLFLGRKSCPPASPIWLKDGFVGKDLVSALKGYPWIGRGTHPTELMLIFEGTKGERVNDVPITFSRTQRRYGARFIQYDSVEPIIEDETEEQV